MDVVNSMRPLPTFDYVPTVRYELSHGHAPVGSLRRSDEVREIARPERNRRPRERNHYCSMGVNTRQTRQEAPDLRSILMELKGHSMLRKPQPMTTVPKPPNTRKYCEFHEQKDHTTAKLPLSAQSLERRRIHYDSHHHRRWICGGHYPVSMEGPNMREPDCEQGSRVTVPTMVFNGLEGPYFSSLHIPFGDRVKSGQCPHPSDLNRFRLRICSSSWALKFSRPQIRSSKTAGEGTDPTAFNARVKAYQEMDQHKRLARRRKRTRKEEQEYTIFTSTMATYSSVTLGGSVESEGARSYDLARCSIRADFVKRSAPKKSTASASLFTDASPTCCWRACRPPGSPFARTAPMPRQRPLS
ncbi:hypothetical protein Cgig2_033969 [Carnegiea gigantea]|uniref:Uncharacterized protein n=1 Tax=Carnegiea gigantea TaxID=171969 RepID=A0A9Q1KCZ4_9CARY|nr:hypothetical protein Cgig2_033969 [Carnegiea gigantea]